MRSDSSPVVGRAGAMREAMSQIDLRSVESPNATELYLTCKPADGRDPRQVEQMFERIASALREAGAWIVEERLFAGADVLEPALATRARAYGSIDDGVAPTLLVPRELQGRVLAAQVHAIRGIAAPAIHKSADGRAVARSFACGDDHYTTASGLRGAGACTTQAHGAFELAEALLTQAGAQLRDIARTWIWMDQILDWYTPFNQVRSAFFTERGMMGVPGRMPASTGIGVSPLGARVSLDVFAAWGREDAVIRFDAAGNQRSANEYGSAFARAARVRTPGGMTIFCSGTAAIDDRGRTCCVDDIDGQIRMTLDNVLAVLRDLGCSSQDVVQAMAYCSNPAVEQRFNSAYAGELPWPHLSMLGDVCRRDLLFEVEVTACAGARRH